MLAPGKKQIGIFAGTFDPPTLGHLRVAQTVLKETEVSDVIFLPCYEHAFGKEPTDFKKRLKMCHILTREEPNMMVSDMEDRLKTKYSVDILEHFVEEAQANSYFDLSFNLIMGTDNYWKMDKWKDPDRVKELAPPIWIRRLGEKDLPPEEKMLELSSSYSSTEFRNAISENDARSVLMTLSSVHDYVLRKNLYKL